VADPRGFLTIRRRTAGYRPALTRLGDHHDQALPPDGALAGSQAGRCMDCGVPFCTAGCPLGNLIPDWNELVRTGRWREASDRLHATNNFPEFTGKLCPAPCEESCVLSVNDDPVTIKAIELTIVDRAYTEGWIVPAPAPAATGRSVAVVGSGPAGLAAAQQLARAGHDVTVFERDDLAGGLLRYGIPDFKLEKHVLDRRLGQLEAEGVRFETGVDVGAALDPIELRALFDAVVVATGAQRHRELDMPGRELAGVELAMPYLTARNRAVAGRPVAGAASAAGRRVVVLGGGDTSADCLGNALREGAAEVHEIAHGTMPPRDRDPQSTWPAWPRVLRSHPVHEEGGSRRWEFETIAFEGDGRVQRVRGAGGDAVDADLVLIAIGFAGVEDDAVYAGLGITIQNGRVHATPEDVFAAGDCVLGADLIVSAIAEGRRAARDVERRLARIAAA
jgi:glutamate synthase (NADPH/NADH) small chain